MPRHPKYADPSRLGPGGRALWAEVWNEQMEPTQKMQLLEVCRAKDRLDRLDEILRGESSTYLEIAEVAEEQVIVLTVDKPLSAANSTLNLMKQVVAALRLPDRNGKTMGRAARTPSGVYDKGSNVSAIERARSRKSG